MREETKDHLSLLLLVVLVGLWIGLLAIVFTQMGCGERDPRTAG